MDEILNSLSNSFEVTKSTNNIYSKHPRFSQYKQKSSKSGDQDVRRKAFLNKQKQRRFDFADHVRCLAVGEWKDETDDCEDVNEKESMEVTTESFHPAKRYKNQLMLSEWLVEVPDDFENEWLMVVCPKGKRNLVVAAGGRTSCYSKSGFCIDTFASCLPGGNNDTRSGYTVLDCIFSPVEQSFHVLDVMCWNNHPVYDSETEFRFFWLASKLLETPELSKITVNNSHKFIGLANCACTKPEITKAINNSDPSTVDGLLFYHKRTHYTFGVTPLVTWLKVYMVEKILNIEPPQVFKESVTMSE